MININRNNYEEYFLDFMEGNLTPSDENLLMLFLERNPDLKEELDSFENELIPAGEVRFENKEMLKKTGILSEITNNNFDDLCVARLEGDLEEVAIMEFDKLIEDNPQKQKEYKLYCLTKTYPQKNIVYPNKNNLKKKRAYRVGSRIYTVISVAATVIILMAVYLFMPKQKSVDNNLPVAELKEETLIDSKNKSKEKPIVEHEIKKLNYIKPRIIVNNSKSTEQLKEVKRDNNNQEPRIKLEEMHQLAYLNPAEIKLESQDWHTRYNTIDIRKNDLKDEEKENKREEYMSVKTFLAATFNKRVLKKDNKDKVELFDLAQAGVKGINKLTGSKMTLEREYDKNGNPSKAEFNSRLIAFSTPIKKE